MKKQQLMLGLGILMATLVLQPGAQGERSPRSVLLPVAQASTDTLQKAALEVLKAKCNVCHRQQNPFMVFSQRNMNGRAAKIYRAVFVQGRMPKGEEIRLTVEERDTLHTWLSTQTRTSS
ncbi:MAG: hypothetical protein AAFQ98_07090 [Bacteroidota bacterium]